MTTFMRSCLIVVFAAAAAAISFNRAEAATITTTTEQLEAQFCPLHPDAKTLAGLKAIDSNFQCSKTSPDRAAKPPVAAKSAPPDQSAKGAAKPPPPLPAPGTVTYIPNYFLRNDWTDLGPLGAGCVGQLNAVPDSKAKGAALSFENDYANKNRIWQSQAMAGLVYTECTQLRISANGDHGVLEKSIAAYAQVNSDYNSNAALAKKNNADTRTAGLSTEWAYLHSYGDIDIIRVTPNVVFDNINNTTAGAVNLQYIPFWLSKGFWNEQGFPGNLNWASLQFQPTIDFQYANAMEHSKPLQFSGKDQSFRIGPELTFTLTPKGGGVWARIGLSETFHPWYEAYTGRGSYWWDNSIFYNFTDDGNFSAKLSYQRGLDENSGVMTNQYTVSLTGKFSGTPKKSSD